MTRIDNLPEKFRLTTTRKKVEKIADLKEQYDDLKDTTEELNQADNKRVNLDRSSSVYGMNLSMIICIELIHINFLEIIPNANI